MAGQETYYFGECTWYVAGALDWIPGGLGNAGDWCANAAAFGFNETLIPTEGSAVVYAPGFGYSKFGHCGKVEQVYGDGTFLVSEMNYVAWDQVDERQSSMWDVACFILAPGMAPGQVGGPGPGRGGPSNDDLYAAWGAWSELQNTNGPNTADYWRAQNAQIDALG